MWCPQHNQYCYEDTCPHGGPRPETTPAFDGAQAAEQLREATRYEAVGGFLPNPGYHGWQQVAKEFEHAPDVVTLYRKRTSGVPGTLKDKP